MSRRLTHLPRQRLAIVFEEAEGLREQELRRRLDHFAIKALDDRKSEAVVFDDDSGVGAVHGAGVVGGYRLTGSLSKRLGT